jgi:ABC-type transport system involved in cytochrome c biogenesis ATPase subunit
MLNVHYNINLTVKEELGFWRALQQNQRQRHTRLDDFGYDTCSKRPNYIVSAVCLIILDL